MMEILCGKRGTPSKVVWRLFQDQCPHVERSLDASTATGKSSAGALENRQSLASKTFHHNSMCERCHTSHQCLLVCIHKKQD